MIFYLFHTRLKDQVEYFIDKLNLNKAFFKYAVGPFEQNKDAIAKFIKSDGRHFVAVGGDGTVFDLMNGLFKLTQTLNVNLNTLHLGAVCAGSSNDFHKSIPKIPVYAKTRCQFENSFPHDLILIKNDKGTFVTSLNASIGVTANANALFNESNTFLNCIKKLNINMAILWVAIKSILLFKPIDLVIDGTKHHVANLGVIKSRFFAGEFSYPSILTENDGLFGVFVIPFEGKMNLLRSLEKLKSENFHLIHGAFYKKVKNLVLQSENDFFIEINGEVFKTKNCHFEILPGALNICPVE